MKKYLSYFRLRLVHSLQYRTAAFAGVLTQFFWGFMEIQLYRAFHLENTDTFPMEFKALVSYIWLRQAFLAFFNTWTFENELFQSILNGNVAYELVRPASLYGMWFSRAAAVRISKAVLRFWPILIVACLLPEPIRLTFTQPPVVFVYFALSMMLTLFVTVAFSLIVYFSCFFTVSSDGLRAVLTPVSDFLSGGLIPLPFMPKTLAAVIRYSPFGAMLNAPLRIFSGDISGAAMWETLFLQVFWTAALVLSGVLLQKKGMSRLTVQGG